MKTLKEINDIYGELTIQERKQIVKFIANPNVINWSNIKDIIVKPKVTILDALIATNQKYSKDGGKNRIPSPIDVLRCIKEVIWKD